MTRLPRSIEELRGLRAARWVRESSRRQLDKYGPDAQRRMQDDDLEALGMVDTGLSWTVAKSGWSGTDSMKEPPATRSADFREMVAAAQAGRYDVLLVGYTSRFIRDLALALHYRRVFQTAGVAIWICDDRILTSNPDDWERFVDKCKAAEVYSRDLSRNIRSGYAAKARQKSDQAGMLPLGFRRGGVAHTAQVDPATMPRALEVWRLAARGLADAAIARETGITLWSVRGVLRSTLFVGRLTDGRPTLFPASLDDATYEQALAHRRSRVRTNGRLRQRTYALSGNGPLVCSACDQPVKGDAKAGRHGERRLVYRHRDGDPCPGWPVREVPAEVLEDQVQQLLDGAKPNRESAARIRIALERPLVAPDRLAIARVDARLRSLGLELASPEQSRPIAQVLEEMAALHADRVALAEAPVDAGEVRPEDALEWLSSLGKLWRETSDQGRRALAVGTFARLGVKATEERRSHRIVEIEATPEAERRGLVLALPTSLVVTVVGDTGGAPTRVTSWPIRIEHRREWLTHVRRRTA